METFKRLPVIVRNSPSDSVPGDENDRRYFKLFYEKFASDLCGYFHTPFWTRLILQECHHEPAIRHQILAISALCEAYTARPDQRDLHLQFALMEQGKAIRQLRKRLSTESVRLASIASVIFGCFESFHGNIETATQQLSSGVRLVRHWRNEKSHKFKNTSSRNLATMVPFQKAIDPEIYEVLERLELPLASFAALNPAYNYTFLEADEKQDINILPITDRFGSLEEAFPPALQLCTLTFHHLRKCIPYKTSSLPITFPDLIIRNQKTLLDAIKRWRVSFHPIFRTMRLDLSHPVHLGALQFDVCCRAFTIIAETSLSMFETVYDEYNEAFQYIINASDVILQRDHDARSVARSIIGKGAHAAKVEQDEDSQMPKFQFVMGLIVPLFYAATRCREPPIRWNAIALLRKWKARDGIWDAVRVARVAEWVISLEEGKMASEQMHSATVPGYTSGANLLIKEEWRVRLHTLKWNVDIKRDEIKVECVQGAGHGKSELCQAILNEF